MLDVYLTDTILPGVLDTHAMALWTYKHSPSQQPIKAEGSRAPYSVSANYITVARTGILQTIGPMFTANSYGLMVDSTMQALPVNWLAFDAQAKQEDVLLHWSTASEINNSHFEIERSANGNNFEFVGRVEGNGTTNSISDYGFTDKDAFSSTYSQVLYYRLKQVDYNGNYEYSHTIAINNNSQSSGGMEFITFPNPFTEKLNLTLNNISEGNVTIEVYDLSGRKHYSNVQFAVKDSLTLDLGSLSVLNRGIYIIHVQNGNISLAHKLVKL